MNNKSTSLKFRDGLMVLWFSALALFAGCAQTVRVNMLQPAQYHEASLTKTVAVLPFNGPGGREFSSEFESILSGIGIDDKPYFTLVDRSTIDKVISEMKLSQSGLVDESTAAKLGNLIGAQGIYTGIVTQNAASDNPFWERRQACIQYEERRDRQGRVFQGRCVRWRQYQVACVRRAAVFSVSPRLVDVETGRVLYSRNLSATTESAGCEDTRPVESSLTLLARARESVKADFRRDIAPYYVTREIRLIDDPEGIDSTDAKDRLKRGLDYADRGRLDAACELWGQARNLSPSSYALLYNLGVCAESRGDLDAALLLYRQADQRLGKPHDDITKALRRTGDAILNREKLREQLDTR